MDCKSRRLDLLRLISGGFPCRSIELVRLFRIELDFAYRPGEVGTRELIVKRTPLKQQQLYAPLCEAADRGDVRPIAIVETERHFWLTPLAMIPIVIPLWHSFLVSIQGYRLVCYIYICRVVFTTDSSCLIEVVQGRPSR